MSNSLVTISEPELLTANQWSKLLGISPQAVRKDCGTGLIARDQLPERHRATINTLMVEHSAGSVTHLRTMLAVGRATWQPNKAFSEKSAQARQKAFKVKEVIDCYFTAFDRGHLDKQCVSMAQAKWSELFGQECNEKTIRRKVAAIRERLVPGQSPLLAPVSMYADQKDVPHHKARIENRGLIPSEFIRAFRGKCVTPGVEHMTSALRYFEIAWMQGEEVPGFGRAENSNSPFPVKAHQLRKFAPGMAARRMGARGKAAAITTALPTMRRSQAELQLAEKIVFDDTRLNMYALDDHTGEIVELKSYWAMDVATRRIVGWLIREAGNVKQADVDALVARVLQTTGFAHQYAGYATTLKFERGAVACSPAKQVILEGLYPGQIIVSRTSMNGGRNAPGDYQQAGTGHWFGKGEIESFMRTLAFFTEHLKGQRGGVFKRQPAQLGRVTWREDGTARLSQGGMLEEAALVAQSGRALALLESHGLDRAPSAAEAADRFNLKAPLYYVHEIMAVMPAVIHYYNTRTDHRREGFLEIREEKKTGGMTFRKESSDERMARLLFHLQNQGIAPVALPDSDAVLLMQKSKTVTVTKNGVTIKIDGEDYRYFDPHSAAIREAISLATLKKECIALYDEECPDRIHLLKNSTATWQRGEEVIYWETLPLDVKPSANNNAAQAKGLEKTRTVHNAVAREMVHAYGSELEGREQERQGNIDTLRAVTVAHGGPRIAAPGSVLARNISQPAAPVIEATTREEQSAQAAPSFIERMAANLSK